jgi:membrane protein
MKAFAREIIESRTTGMAAEMAFWLFLSLIPLAAVAGLVIARVAVSSADATAMLDSLPPETRHLVAKQLTHGPPGRGAVGAPAAIVFFWLASGGIHSVSICSSQGGASRSWLMKRLIALGACLALSVGTAIIAVLAGLRRVLGFLQGAVSLQDFRATRDRRLGCRVALGILTAVGLVAGLYFIGIPRRARNGCRSFPAPFWPLGFR